MTDSDDAFVRCAVEAGVALVTLNRPERLNAFNAELGVAYDKTIVSLGKNPDVRAVVITGAGRGFCAGADAGQLANLSDAGAKGLASRPPGARHPIYDRLVDAPPEMRTRFLSPAALPKPVIAAVNGACAGVGLAIACYCDVRFASEEAVFAASFSRRGLVAEAGLAWILPRIIGHGAASDMLISGRTVGADEARDFRLVSDVTSADALLDRAMAYARDLADNVSPRSVAVIRRQLWQGADQSLREALDLGYKELKASLDSADFREGVAAFRERRSPKFEGC